MIKNLRFAFSFALAATFAVSLWGQNKADLPLGEIITLGDREAAPGVTLSSPSNQLPLALFDVEFIHQAADSAGLGGMAGVAWTGTEFWVSRWQSDTLLTFDINGSCTDTFTIPTLSGTRALTFDGTTLYAVNNTNTIYKINPNTKALTGSITVAMTQVRHCTYDATANSGGGGFWIGNWATDLQQVDLSGNLLATIPAATHGLTSMYGSAWENQTAGGPYLWIFHQGGSSQCTITRLQLPSGTPTPVSHDVMTDVGAASGSTSALAGGLFITNTVVPSEWTIVGLAQSQPNNVIFGYELNDYTPPAYDASVDTARLNPGYTQIPDGHASNLSVHGNIRNAGVNTLNTVNMNVTITQGASTVYSNTQSSNNLTSGSNISLDTPNFTLTGTGTYDIKTKVTLTGQTDLVASNDSILNSVEVTDSTYARDNGVATGNAYNVGGTEWAWVTTNYTIPVSDTLSSVWIRLEEPLDGDTTYAVVCQTIDGVPVSLIAQSPIAIISAAQTDYVLAFPNGVALNAGEYAIGVYEGYNTSIGLAQSASVFTPGVSYFYDPVNGWIPSSIATSRFIRPNFGNVSSVSRDDAKETPVVSVFPNPAGDYMSVRCEGIVILNLSVKNLLGETLYTATPGNSYHTLSTAEMASGLYFVEAETASGKAVEKFVVKH